MDEAGNLPTIYDSEKASFLRQRVLRASKVPALAACSGQGRFYHEKEEFCFCAESFRPIAEKTETGAVLLSAVRERIYKRTR